MIPPLYYYISEHSRQRILLINEPEPEPEPERSKESPPECEPEVRNTQFIIVLQTDLHVYNKFNNMYIC